jgi:outer membrane protein assembly factor BamD
MAVTIQGSRTAWFWPPAAIVALALLVGACQSDKDEYVERPVDELYNSAMNDMNEGNYQGAAKLFDEVERQHPYSPWATRAQLMAAFAHYEANQYDDAVVAIDRFVELHPANPDVPYALYLKGLCYYERISTVERDQEMTELAKRSFQELISRFPSSEYARAAKVKLELAIDNLAGKEMVVGRFYLQQKNYLAAINRFKRVVEVYQATTHVPEALLRMTEAYTAIGLHDEARKTAAVLGYNYPESEWYADAYALVGRPVSSGTGG